ncbi:hypothetical protein I4U23_009706 [Adineta vaga]|nr:hypothetical protein I4U23_009706 [Adineta vaga]
MIYMFSIWLSLLIGLSVNNIIATNLRCNEDINDSFQVIENCRACVIFIAPSTSSPSTSTALMTTKTTKTFFPRNMFISNVEPSIEELFLFDEKKRRRRRRRRQNTDTVIHQQCAREIDGPLYGYDQTHCYCNSNQCNSNIQRCIYEVTSKRHFACYHGTNSSQYPLEIRHKCRSCRIRQDFYSIFHYECLTFGEREQNNKTHCTCQRPMCNQDASTCQRLQQGPSKPRTNLVYTTISNSTILIPFIKSISTSTVQTTTTKQFTTTTPIRTTRTITTKTTTVASTILTTSTIPYMTTATTTSTTTADISTTTVPSTLNPTIVSEITVTDTVTSLITTTPLAATLSTVLETEEEEEVLNVNSTLLEFTTTTTTTTTTNETTTSYIQTKHLKTVYIEVKKDYWRKNNVENLLRDVTHVLTQRMPSDPAVAIVQYLHKKFPKSFPTFTDNNSKMNATSKTTVDILQTRPTTSARSDFNTENHNDTQLQHRASIQSQTSDIVTIPTNTSAFTNMLNRDTDSSRQAPEINLKNLIFANRIGQQVIRFGKDIRSDHDILQEEFLKPKKQNASSTHAHMYPTSEDLQQLQTHEEPSAQQLIKYKEQIHTENHRRQHREKLANLAKQIYDRERILQPDLVTVSEEVQQDQMLGDDHTQSHVVSTGTSTTKPTHKPMVKSTAEEEFLNDENIFHPRRQRHRQRHNNNALTSRTDAPYSHRQSIVYFGSSRRQEDGDRMALMQDCVCKACGNIINTEDLRRYSQQLSGILIFFLEPIVSSVKASHATVNDWFGSSLNASDSRSMVSLTTDQITPPPTSTNPFEQDFFQSIDDTNDNNIQHRPLAVPIIIIDSHNSSQHSRSTRLSESDTFVRTSSPKVRYSPTSSRKMPSPNIQNRPSSNTPTNSSFSRPVVVSPLKTTIIPNAERRMSGWSVRELSPDDSDEN